MNSRILKLLNSTGNNLYKFWFLHESGRLRGIILVVGLLLVMSTLANAQTIPMSLQGEVFSGTVQQVSGTCNPDGNSTISFSSTGTAFGPYEGTYTETGTVTIGPQDIVGGGGSVGGAIFDAGLIGTLDANFQIFSSSGEVLATGTKVESATAYPGPNTGVCANFDVGDLPFFPFQSGTVRQVQSGVAYDATIHASSGNFPDSGTGRTSFTQLLLCFGELCTSSTAFTEEFLMSSGVIPVQTPGKATGGGQIDHAHGTQHIAFGFEVKSDGQGNLHGRCVVIEQVADTKVECLNARQYGQFGNTAIFSGDAEVNGSRTTYRIEVQDNAESGIDMDTFAITTDSGYAAGGRLTQGNIQIHK